MNYLVDTNILLRFADRTHPLHTSVRTVIQRLKQANHTLQIVPQNCAEFWNVVTRPVDRNGLGLTPNDADRLLHFIERLFPVLPDAPAVYAEWRRLVVTFSVSGVQVHDARLVAAINVNRMTHILTLNTADFSRYASEGIVAINPVTLLEETL